MTDQMSAHDTTSFEEIVVIHSLLGIDYAQYQPLIIKSVQKWNEWNGVLNNFIKGLK